MLGQPRKNLREQAQKYQFEEMQFPTIKQLTQQSVAKSCGMLKDYFVKGGDAERFIEGVRALQLREFITQKPLLTDEIFRFELEGLYEESDWSDHLREFFDMMVVLMGQLKQVQLKQRVLRENRLLGLRQVVAEGKAAVAQMKEEWTNETAEAMGGTAACGVTV